MHMTKGCFILAFLFVISITAMSSESLADARNKGIHVVSSNADFTTVYTKAVSFIKSKGLSIFAEFDHAKNAQDVQLNLAPTTVIVFGSPLVGTKLMQEFPGIGMDLPLKVLISQDKNGKVSVSYEDLATTFAPYGVQSDHNVLQKMQGLLQALAKNATQ